MPNHEQREATWTVQQRTARKGEHGGARQHPQATAFREPALQEGPRLPARMRPPQPPQLPFLQSASPAPTALRHMNTKPATNNFYPSIPKALSRVERPLVRCPRPAGMQHSYETFHLPRLGYLL